MTEVVMQARTFKARCLALLDEVALLRSTIVVTKHGQPVTKLVPMDDLPLVPMDDLPQSTRGSVTLLAEDDEAYFSTGEAWHAER
ncbi:MAG: type II toxin-antitoxin system Phd/YefM family antitoxin [Pseudonocardiales bacterium]